MTKNMSWEEILKNAEVQYKQLLKDSQDIDSLPKNGEYGCI